MLSPVWVVGASFAYLLLLFAVASFGDWRAAQGRSIIANPWTYALSLAVYCTAWTYSVSYTHLDVYKRQVSNA